MKAVGTDILSAFQPFYPKGAPCHWPESATQSRWHSLHIPSPVLSRLLWHMTSAGSLSVISWWFSPSGTQELLPSPGSPPKAWKRSLRYRDLSDSVQRTMGQGPQLLEANFLLLRAGAEGFQWSIPISIILGCPVFHGPLSSHQKAMPCGKLQQQHRIAQVYKVV